MRTIDEVIKSYSGVHTTTMLSVLRGYNQWESIPYEKKKWKRGKEQMTETKAIETILKKRGIDFEKIVGKRKK